MIPFLSNLGYPGYLGSAWATLLCYAMMVGIAYVLGQKHYPIPYKIGRMMLYILIVVALYGGYSQWIKPSLVENSVLSYLVSLGILGVYLGIVIVLDGKRIRQIVRQTPIE